MENVILPVNCMHNINNNLYYIYFVNFISHHYSRIYMLKCPKFFFQFQLNV